jgi:LysM repeat protein
LLILISGLLLVAAAACTDQTTTRAPTTAVTPDVADIEPIATAQLETYIVQPGDFLSGIAARYQITLEKLTTHNQIVDAALLDAGQLLEIPGTEVVSIDSFFAAIRAERFPELYSPQQLPPPPPSTVVISPESTSPPSPGQNARSTSSPPSSASSLWPRC